MKNISRRVDDLERVLGTSPRHEPTEEDALKAMEEMCAAGLLTFDGEQWHGVRFEGGVETCARLLRRC